MKAKQEIYCRLEHLCFYEIKDRQPLIKEKSLLSDEDNELEYNEFDVYLEKYQDFTTVEARILELNQIWRERHPERERYWTKEEKEAYLRGEIFDEYRDIYLPIILYNRWGDYMIVIVTYAGWFMSAASFYTLEYIDNSKRFGEFDPIKEKTFLFYLPQWTEFSERDCISKKVACSLIKEWLDTGEYTKYFLNKAGEIKTIKYTFEK